MAERRGRIVLVILAVVTALSLLRTVSVDQQKRRLSNEYRQAQQAIQNLSKERAHLSDELTGAKGTIEGQAGQLSNLQHELDDVQARLDKTVNEIATLQQEHEQLRAQNTTLSTQLSSAIAERQQLEYKLSSLKELRLAIRDVKRKIWQERWAAWYVHVEAQKHVDEERLASGNRGYLVRDGKSTLASSTSTKLQVHVLEPQVQ